MSSIFNGQIEEAVRHDHRSIGPSLSSGELESLKYVNRTSGCSRLFYQIEIMRFAEAGQGKLKIINRTL